MKRFTLLVALFTLTYSLYAHDGISPVAKHGSLSVRDGKIINEKSQPVSLAGPSLFWSNNGWQGEAYYNHKVIGTIASQWHAGLVRVSMGVDGEGGFLELPKENRVKAQTVIDAAIANGLYVVIDFHSHHAHEYTSRAVAFFERMARKYGDYPNVIYEIYNEPLNDVKWSSVVKPYSERIIEAIRQYDPDNLILVGTPSWSQDVDEAAKDPIKGHINIAYSLHFYAGTHKQDLRDKAQVALNAGLALFVSEWGTVNANGDGDIDFASTKAWLTFIRENQLSHASWALSDKSEGASFLVPGAPVNGQWQERHLTPNGKFLRDIIREWEY